MGGRGASSSNKIRAVVIDFGDGIKKSYRQQPNGYISDLGGYSSEKMNVNIDGIIKMAKEKGYTIKTYNTSQLKEYDKKRQSERKENDKFLDFHWYERTKSGRVKRPRYGMKGH